MQIIDRFHAKERLHTLSKNLFADRQLAQDWVQQRCLELDAGRIETLLSEPATEAAHNQEAKAACTYFVTMMTVPFSSVRLLVVRPVERCD